MLRPVAASISAFEHLRAPPEVGVAAQQESVSASAAGRRRHELDRFMDGLRVVL
jgi:hypothetical protein